MIKQEIRVGQFFAFHNCRQLSVLPAMAELAGDGRNSPENGEKSPESGIMVLKTMKCCRNLLD